MLPFVASAAVDRFGWLTADDMVAGLALGESTPGPLIMVNTFVGFLAGYNVEGGLAWGLARSDDRDRLHVRPLVRLHHQRRTDHRPDPHDRRVRSLAQRHHDRVVGVIAALAVFVARHAAFADGEPDWLVIVLAAVAFVAAWRFRVGVVTTVASCAAVGLVAALFD